ncbi:MAG: hypothetical protein DRO87_11325 [Candidatus Thorarchaeota archaeon]|nr:MAG: hypothetical protein DRO87_11325 [Candidatus Thorarchaeota archaeon]
MIYTSYFARLKDVRNLGITPVSVAQGLPRGIEILSYRKLAPPWGLIKEYKRTGDESLYTRVYFETILNKFNQYKVITDILLLALEPNVALICFEKPGDFCHRHLIAQWLNQILPEKERIRELEF